MSDAPDLLKNLQIKVPTRLVLIGAPPGYADRLAPADGLTNVAMDAPPVGETFDAVHRFVRTAADIAALALSAAAAVRPGGLLWVSYPKRGKGVETDINRDLGWAPLRDAGWGGVRQIAIDETSSAMRFRPTADLIRR